MLAVAGLLAGTEAARAGNNLLKVRDAFYTTGSTVIIYIDVTNEDAIRDIQFSLSFPSGLTFDGVSAALTNRKQDHSFSFFQQPDGSWLFLGISFTRQTFLGNSGPIAQITCSATGGVGTYPVTVSGVRFTYASGTYSTTAQSGQIVVFNPANAAKARIVNRLEGFNSSPYMTTTLATNHLIPLTSPYTDAPRTVSSVPASLTDWILLELRLTPSGSPVYRQSYFLRPDGNLAEMDGTTTSLTLGVPAGNYWIVLHHRNHAAVMSATAQNLTTTVTFFDFTSATSQYYGSGGTPSNGRWIMPAGDLDQDGHLTSKDYVRWYKKKLAAPAAGYYVEDLNGDGLVTDADFTLWQTNARLGLDSRLP